MISLTLRKRQESCKNLPVSDEAAENQQAKPTKTLVSIGHVKQCQRSSASSFLLSALYI